MTVFKVRFADLLVHNALFIGGLSSAAITILRHTRSNRKRKKIIRTLNNLNLQNSTAFKSSGYQIYVRAHKYGKLGFFQVQSKRAYATHLDVVTG